jgi:ribonuclease BN (tRNA processing enzyme)
VFAAIAGLALTTQIVLLGTGSSRPAPERSGRATAIVVGRQAYLIDFGPGVVQRAAIAHRKGLAALDPVDLVHVFVTNLSSAHTAGYPDLVFTPPGRKQPLEVYGPPGTRKMTEHVLAAWADEAGSRRVNVHEIAPGIVYRDAKVTVTAFSGGYRFQTPDRRIVIAGETSPSEDVVAQCNGLGNGCDVLIHEVSMQSARRVGELATRARPELLVLHQLRQASDRSSDNQLTREVQAAYRGRFLIGHDLDVL